MEFIGRQFVGMPYKSGTLEMEPETLTINLDEFDCTTFIETVTALALTIEDRKNSWQDFANNLESLRYRQGEANGYASRLHYFSDWIVTNIHRGYIKEVTDRIPQSDSQIKTLDYMSHNRASYPALKDSATFEGIKNMEVGYRSHRFPYIKSARLTSKPVTNALQRWRHRSPYYKDRWIRRKPRRAYRNRERRTTSSARIIREGKVVVDKLPLAEYMRKSSNLTGIRVIRLQTQ